MSELPPPTPSPQSPDATLISSPPAEVPTQSSLSPQEHTSPGETKSGTTSSTVVDVGSQLGPYKLVDKLGEGGMGAVFKAQQTRLGRMVALKVLPPHVMSRPDALARFDREMKAVGSLHHPNIVQALDAGEFGGVHYLSMEYVEGQDLQELVKAKGPLSIVNACKAIRQAAQGLAAAHKLGLVHRDIKPSNLFVTKQTGQIKILDMGLALLSHEEVPAALTSTGQCFGTPDYMAPEQWNDAHTCDARADLYSLGCTLFYLLVGHPPYPTETHRTAANKMKGHVIDPIPDLRAARSDVPPGLIAIYERLMAKQPEDRFASAAELAETLAPFSSNKGAATQPAIPTAPESDPALSALEDGPPGRTIPEVGAAAEPLDPTSTWTPESAASPAVQSIHAPPPGSRRRRLLTFGGAAALVLLGVIIITITRKDGTKTTVKVPEGTNISVDAGPDGRVDIAAAGTTDSQPTGWHGWPANAPKPAIAPFNADQAKTHQEEWAAYLKVPVEYTNSIGMKFRLIPPGEFLMGTTRQNVEETLSTGGWDGHFPRCLISSAPRHKTILTQPIYLGVYEVTQADYETTMGKNPSVFAKTGSLKWAVEKVAGLDTTRHPVEMVSWEDSAEFCQKLSLREGLKPCYSRTEASVTPLDGTGYKLPSEAHWEFACQAGMAADRSLRDQDEELQRSCWWRDNSTLRTHVVGELPANPFGLYDIQGNVFEWVQDWWDLSYYEEFRETVAFDPTGVKDPTEIHGTRGGSWAHAIHNCRSSSRMAFHRGEVDFGFRVALPIDAVRQALKVTGPPIPKPAATAPSAPAGHPIDFAAERHAAERLLKLKKGTGFLHKGDGTPIAAGSPFEKGDDVELQAPLPKEPFFITQIVLREVDLTDAELAVLAGCRQLEKLTLDGNPQLTAAGMQALGSLPKLTYLDLSGTACARDSLEFVANYVKLQFLSLRGSQAREGAMQTLPICRHLTYLETPNLPGSVADEGLRTITLHCPELTSLGLLDDGQFQSLGELRRVPNLKHIHCNNIHLNDAGIEVLADCPVEWLMIDHADGPTIQRLGKLKPKLRELTIREQGVFGKQITDPTDWTSITRLSDLERLSINYQIAIDAAALQAVTKMPRLKSFTIESGGLTDELRAKFRNYTAADIDAFRKARPDVELRIDGMVYPAVAASDDPIDFAAERQAAERLLKLKKGVVWLKTEKGADWELKDPPPLDQFYIFSADFTKTDLTNEELAVVMGLRGLVDLRLQGNSKLTPAGLRALGSLPLLNKLDLRFTECANDGLEFIANYPRLESLDLLSGSPPGIMRTLPPCPKLKELDTTGDGSVGDEGLQMIAQQCPELTRLHVWDAEVRSLIPLSKLRKLKAYYGYGGHLNSVGVDTLADLPAFDTLGCDSPDRDVLQRLAKLDGKLRELTLRNQLAPVITDASNWIPVTRFPSLEKLAVDGTIAVDAAALQAVSKMSRLKSFDVGNVLTGDQRATFRKYTQDDIEAFRNARPDVEVRIDGKVYPAAAKADAPIDFAAERQVAEWVLSLGGQLQLIDGSGNYIALVDGKLPDTPFAVARINISNGAKGKDDDLARLARCRQLAHLTLSAFSGTGSGLSHLVAVRSLRELNLSDSGHISDSGLQALSSLPHLRNLQISRCPNLTDQCLAHVGHLVDLEELELGGTPVGDAGVKHLSRLARLRRHGVGSRVTDAGIKQLLEQHPNLETLFISSSDGSERTLIPVATSHSLHELVVSGNQMTADGLRVLQAMPTLRRLHVGTPMTTDNVLRIAQVAQLREVHLGFFHADSTSPGDDTFASLARLPHLEQINVFGDEPSPGDSVLEAWAGIPNLKGIILQHNEGKRRYTPAGIAKFRELRPDVELHIDGKVYPASSAIPFSVIQKLDETDPLPKWELPAGSPPPVVAPCTPEEAAALQQKWAEHLKRPVVEEVATPAGLGMKFALIPPGEFRKIFTRPRDPALEPDMPVRRFRITKPYAMSTTEVTWDQFRQFVEATGYKTEAETNGVAGLNRSFKHDPKLNWRTPGWEPAPNEPVTQVGLRDAEAYCAWLTKISEDSNPKRLYRLPTEAEWVHACRAGSVHRYVVGLDAQDLAEYAWSKEFVDPDPQASPLHLVGTKKANPFGLHDTIGNVSERVLDVISPALAPYVPTNDPVGNLSDGVISGSFVHSNSTLGDIGEVYAPHPPGAGHVGFRVLKQFDAEPLPGPLDRPLLVRPGQPLSVHAMVPRPERIPGLQSWSVELAGMHSEQVLGLAACSERNLIATGSEYGKISLWNREGEYQRALLGHEGHITSLDFSTDGHWLASCEMNHGTRGHHGDTARVWNVDTGTLHAIFQLPGSQAHRIKFSPDGKLLAVTLQWGEVPLAVINLVDGQLRNVVTGANVSGVAWSADSSELACSHADTLRVFDTKTFQVLRKIAAPTSLALEWSPDGKWLAHVNREGTVSIRNATTLEETKKFGSKVIGTASPFHWLPDSERLVVGHLSEPSGIFNTVTGDQVASFGEHTADAAFTVQKNGTEFVLHKHFRLHFYDTATGKKLRDGKELQVWAGGKLSADGREVIAPGNSIVNVFDAATGQRQRSFQVPFDTFVPVPAPDHKFLALWNQFGPPELPLIDAEAGALRETLKHEAGNVTRVAWSPDGKSLATGATDKLVRVWNVGTGKTEHKLAGHTGTILSLAWSPDSTRLASVAADKTVRLWDPRLGKLIAAHDKFPEEITLLGTPDLLAWTSDSRQLWIALNAHIVPLDVETGTLGPLENFSNGGPLTLLNMSPDGQRLLARENYGWTHIRGRDAQDRRLLGKYLGRTAQWHPDSRRFLGWEPGYGTVGFDVEKNHRLGMLFPWLTGDHWLCVGPTGHYRGSPGVEEQIVYVAMHEDGSQRTYTPKEFAEKFGWKNDPEKAELLGK